MCVVSIKLPLSYLEALDELVKAGVYPSRSEAIRDAVRRLLEEKVWDRGWAVRSVRSDKLGSRKYFVEATTVESGDYM